MCRVCFLFCHPREVHSLRKQTPSPNEKQLLRNPFPSVPLPLPLGREVDGRLGCQVLSFVHSHETFPFDAKSAREALT